MNDFFPIEMAPILAGVAFIAKPILILLVCKFIISALLKVVSGVMDKSQLDKGITGFILTARLPNSPDAIDPSIISTQDLQRALQVIRSRAKEWGIDPEKVGIMGASAGGNLAAQAATQFTSEEDRPDFQVLFYASLAMSKSAAQSLLGGDESEEAIDRYWPTKQVKENTPPAFLLCSADDRTVPCQNSIEYFQALRAKGIQATLHIYPSGGHGWGYEEWMPYKREWTAELERWLEQWTR